MRREKESFKPHPLSGVATGTPDSHQRLESDISALRELVVLLSDALLRSIARSDAGNYRSDDFAEAEQLLHVAEVFFRGAIDPSASKAESAGLTTAGQQAMAKAVEIENDIQNSIAHSRRNAVNVGEMYRSTKLRVLTPREMAIFKEVASGASSKQVARNLNISPRTVDAHRANILQKLGAKSTVELIRIVMTQWEPKPLQTAARAPELGRTE